MVTTLKTVMVCGTGAQPVSGKLGGSVPSPQAPPDSGSALPSSLHPEPLATLPPLPNAAALRLWYREHQSDGLRGKWSRSPECLHPCFLISLGFFGSMFSNAKGQGQGVLPPPVPSTTFAAFLPFPASCCLTSSSISLPLAGQMLACHWQDAGLSLAASPLPASLDSSLHHVLCRP